MFHYIKGLARHRVRGTTQGANNRLDLLRLVTTGVSESEIKNHEGGMLGFIEGWPENETHDPDVPAISHSRGLSPCVFVPFNEVPLLCLHLLFLRNIRRCKQVPNSLCCYFSVILKYLHLWKFI